MNDNDRSYRQAVRRSTAFAAAENIARYFITINKAKPDAIEVRHGFFPGSVEIGWGKSKRVSRKFKQQYEAELRGFFGDTVTVEKFRANKRYEWGKHGGLIVSVGY